MGDKKNILIIGLIVILAVIVGVFLWMGMEDINGEFGDIDPSEETGVEFVRESHLFRAGTGGELGARNEGEAVTDFNPGDYLGVSGEYSIEEDVRISGNLLDRNEGVAREDFLPSFNAHETERSGFSMCCAGVPNRPNDYYIELVAKDERIDLIPFSVVEEGGEVEEVEEIEETEEDDDEIEAEENFDE